MIPSYKKAAALLVLLSMLLTNALAFSGTNYPAWDGTSPAENSLHASFDGTPILLEFDAGSDYSNTYEGILQACFFAFDSAQQNYLELYLQLPENIASGDVFSSQQSSGMAAVSLYEVARETEDLYYAGQLAGFAYPSGSSCEIHIESVQRDGGMLRVRGSISATLIQIKNNIISDTALKIENGSFDFALPANASPSAAPKSTPAPENTAAPDSSAAPQPTMPPRAESSPAPAAPKTTMDPHPAFTLPPDYCVL